MNRLIKKIAKWCFRAITGFIVLVSFAALYISFTPQMEECGCEEHEDVSEARPFAVIATCVSLALFGLTWYNPTNKE